MNASRLWVSTSFALGLTVLASTLRAGEPPGPSPAPATLPAGFSTPSATEKSLVAKPSAGPASAPVRTPVTLVSALTNPLFMAEYVSTRTRDGIAGFTPGCPVRLVGINEEAGKLTVADGRFQVEVTFAQVTDDPKLAATLQRQTEGEDQATKRIREATQLAQAQAARKLAETRRRAQAAGYRLPPLHFGYTALGAGMNEPSAPWEQLLGKKYPLRGDPYTPEHTVVPRLGPDTRPAANPLDQNRNYLGFY